MRMNLVIRHIIVFICLIGIITSNIYADPRPGTDEEEEAGGSLNTTVADEVEDLNNSADEKTPWWASNTAAVIYAAASIYLLDMCLKTGQNSRTAQAKAYLDSIKTADGRKLSKIIHLPEADVTKALAGNSKQELKNIYDTIYKNFGEFRMSRAPKGRWWPTRRSAIGGGVLALTIIALFIWDWVDANNAKNNETELKEALDRIAQGYQEKIENMKIKPEDMYNEQHQYRVVSIGWFVDLKRKLVERPDLVNLKDKDVIRTKFEAITGKYPYEDLFPMFRESFNYIIDKYENGADTPIDLSRVRMYFLTKYYALILKEVFQGTAVLELIQSSEKTLEEHMTREDDTVSGGVLEEIYNSIEEDKELYMQKKLNVVKQN